jgi:hypothetical protein
VRSVEAAFPVTQQSGGLRAGEKNTEVLFESGTQQVEPAIDQADRWLLRRHLFRTACADVDADSQTSLDSRALTARACRFRNERIARRLVKERLAHEEAEFAEEAGRGHRSPPARARLADPSRKPGDGALRVEPRQQHRMARPIAVQHVGGGGKMCCAIIAARVRQLAAWRRLSH